MAYKNQDAARAARRRWYAKNRERECQKTVERTKEQRRRNRLIVLERKSRPCTDCGIQYPYWVMQFDHVTADKDRDIRALAHAPAGVARLEREMMKCEVVCANCHAERTYRRWIGLQDMVSKVPPKH